MAASFSLFEVESVMTNSINRALLSWQENFVGKRRKKASKVASLCIFWIPWQERKQEVR